ncbi:MAG: very short patch repair endonuclease [Coriobacteriales bacterium]|nr:very short patch repair endonuclease [Coriobacteriales bacterium]
MLSPPAQSPAVRKSMQGNKSKDTKPELKVRKLLRDAGFSGYRLQWKKAPGRPDIAYPGRKIAIFVNGCFWHRCPKCNLPTPKTNPEYWEEKFCRNVKRDKQKVKELEEAGWTVFVIWECELKKPEKKEFEYMFVTLSNNG